MPNSKGCSSFLCPEECVKHKDIQKIISISKEAAFGNQTGEN
jgi:hypothetical protein